MAGAARRVDSSSLARTEPGTPGCGSHDMRWSETALARPGINQGILSLLEIRPPPHPPSAFWGKSKSLAVFQKSVLS